jgi:hypothetical protein
MSVVSKTGFGIFLKMPGISLRLLSLLVQLFNNIILEEKFSNKFKI